jgi:anti-sigma B factor antagonist
LPESPLASIGLPPPTARPHFRNNFEDDFMLSKQSASLLQIAEVDGRVTVRFPAGTTLSEANSEEFSRELLALAENKERPQLVVDLGGVTMLTSVILSKFIALNRKVTAVNGQLALVNLTPLVRDVFRATRLDILFKINETANPLPA